MRGADFCRNCERRTAFALVGRRATREELAGTDLEGLPEVGTIGWECLACGALGEGSLDRLVAHLAALGLEPRPAGGGVS
jgi:hypothetical protein